MVRLSVMSHVMAGCERNNVKSVEVIPEGERMSTRKYRGARIQIFVKNSSVTPAQTSSELGERVGMQELSPLPPPCSARTD